MDKPKEITDYNPASFYPLLHRLYQSGYTIQGLRTILSHSERRLADTTCKTLLTTETDSLSVRQVVIIAGLLGCQLSEVMQIIFQTKEYRYIKTAQALNGKIRTPTGYVSKQQFNKTFDPNNVPAPGWLDEIK